MTRCCHSVLVNGPVQVGPAAGDLHIRFIDEPSVAGTVPVGPGRVHEQGREALYPPVDRDVIDLEAVFGQELLDVPVGLGVPQVPADRQPDHLGREPEPGELRHRS
ncbi:hypothetical protein CC117_25920 [Parafrankia colletiae]|uniref:Uncharacterized protein n=1 Tax=Parafrankia colletiae TaxID=573497 RepID=A0A1S1QCS7_9ACTN|nr:hypothetical protein CC117_25920 [Parafrankia colletiae]